MIRGLTPPARLVWEKLPRLLWTVTGAAVLLLPSGAAARADDDAGSRRPALVTAACREALERGLAFLAAQQDEDGSFAGSRRQADVAVSALAGLAFMASGSTPGRGPYGRQVDRCLAFVLARAEPSGLIAMEDSSAQTTMYGHGYATLLLAVSYGMSDRDGLRPKLTSAVQLIVRAQNKEGGWRYQPDGRDADISVTVCQSTALWAAHHGGLYVPPDTIARCTDYVKQCQNADGGFRYTLAKAQASAFARSAAGLVALQAAGSGRGPEIDRGLAYLQRHLPLAAAEQPAAKQPAYYFYGHFYAVQAMWRRGGTCWSTWYPAVRDQLVALQRPDGAWHDTVSDPYGTAMACFILAVPENYLPAFER